MIPSPCPANARELLARGYGLVVTAGDWSPPQSLALWEALSARTESLYLIGPLADKPVLSGGAKVWLLECPLEQRAAGLREVLRRDPHGIVLIGDLTAAEAELAVQASLCGCLCIVAGGRPTVAEAVAALRTAGVEPHLIAAALLGGCTPEAAVPLSPDQIGRWIAGGAVEG